MYSQLESNTKKTLFTYLDEKAENFERSDKIKINKNSLSYIAVI